MVLLRFVFFNTRCHSQYLNELLLLFSNSEKLSLSLEAAANIKPFFRYQNCFEEKYKLFFCRNIKTKKINAFRQINYSILRKNASGYRLSKSHKENLKNSPRLFPEALIARQQRRVAEYLQLDSPLCWL